MKLSDIKGERTFEVIEEISDPIVSILEDDELSDKIQAVAGLKGAKRSAAIVKVAKTIVAKHKDDAVSILASIGNVDRDEYEKSLDMGHLIKDIFELLTDEEFLSFLS